MKQNLEYLEACSSLKSSSEDKNLNIEEQIAKFKKWIHLEGKESKINVDKKEFSNFLENFFWQANEELSDKIDGELNFSSNWVGIQKNIVESFRKYFQRGKSIFEIETSVLTPKNALNISGHLPLFEETMVHCQIGHKQKKREVFLRPESASAIFSNFKGMFLQNDSSLPFGAFQIGKMFRNDFQPKISQFRLREFTVIEAEFFFTPNLKNEEHLPFYSINDDYKLNLLTSANQLKGSNQIQQISVSDILKNKICSKEIINLMANYNRFLSDLGIPQNSIRFREYPEFDLPHYSQSCFDCEIFGIDGILQIANFNIRKDLAKYLPPDFPKRKLSSKKVILEIKPANKKSFFEKWKIKGSKILKYLNEINEKDKEILLKKELCSVEVDGEKFELKTEDFLIEKVKISEESFIPTVIEVAFGLSRVLISLLQNSFYLRKSDNRRVLKLPPHIAQFNCGMIFVGNKQEKKINFASKDLISLFIDEGIEFETKFCKSMNGLGKRYSKWDEIGVPFILTVIFNEENSQIQSLTLRERDSTTQILLKKEEASSLILSLSSKQEKKKIKWEEIVKTYPIFKN